jgi:hypothetical protein
MPETEIIFSVQESPEGGYEARALGHSIFTQADTMDELKLNVREAARCHFDEGKAPPVIRLHSVKDEFAFEPSRTSAPFNNPGSS